MHGVQNGDINCRSVNQLKLVSHRGMLDRMEGKHRASRTNPRPTDDTTNPSIKHHQSKQSGARSQETKRQWGEVIGGFLTVEEEAREGAGEGGVGDAADGEVEARVPLDVQVVPRQDPRLGRRGRGRRRRSGHGR
jgi:hypothetical protein